MCMKRLETLDTKTGRAGTFYIIPWWPCAADARTARAVAIVSTLWSLIVSQYGKTFSINYSLTLHISIKDTQCHSYCIKRI